MAFQKRLQSTYIYKAIICYKVEKLPGLHTWWSFHME